MDSPSTPLPRSLPLSLSLFYNFPSFCFHVFTFSLSSLSCSIGQGEQDIHDTRKRQERHEHGMDGKHNRFNKWSSACTTLVRATSYKQQIVSGNFKLLTMCYESWIIFSPIEQRRHTTLNALAKFLFTQRANCGSSISTLTTFSFFSPLSVSPSLSIRTLYLSIYIYIYIQLYVYIYLSSFFFMYIYMEPAIYIYLSLFFYLSPSLSSWWSTSCLLESAPLLHMRNTLRFFIT